MEHHRDPELAPEPLGIPAKGLERLRGGLEQQAVDRLRVALRQGIECVWQGKDDMEVGHEQKLCTARLYPALFRQSLAPFDKLRTGFGQCRLRQEWKRSTCVPQESHCSRCPPSSAVRQLSMARITRCC